MALFFPGALARAHAQAQQRGEQGRAKRRREESGEASVVSESDPHREPHPPGAWLID